MFEMDFVKILQNELSSKGEDIDKTNVMNRVSEVKDTFSYKEMMSLTDEIKGVIERNKYLDLLACIEFNNEIFAEQGYKLGFYDGIRFVFWLVAKGEK
jgi:hypothetical protein